MDETGVHPSRHQDAGPTEDNYVLSAEFVREVREALRGDDPAAALPLVQPLHYADAADLIQQLTGDDRTLLIETMRPQFDPEILPELEPPVRDEVIAVLGYADLAAALVALDSDDAVYVVDQLDEEERALVLGQLPSAERTLIEQGLSYPDYTAGRLMQRELVAVPDYWTVGETIDYCRANARLPEDFYVIYIVDPRHRPVGTVRLSRVLRARRSVRLRDIIEPGIQPVPVTTDQEEVAFLFRQQDLLAAPVVDKSGRLVGTITVDDVVDVIDEEAQDDLLKLGGVPDTDIYRAVWDTTRARFTWLLVNLATAFLASMVIGQFEETLEKVVALAVLMPIVASMGGNAGTQTLTIAVRALATRELTAANAVRIVGKETLVGLLNGMSFAVLTGIVAWFWFGDTEIGLIIAAAMVINMLAAGLFGILIPLALDRLKIDPAVSSSVFLTTVTDVVGFLSFLGLAAAFYL